MDLSQPPKGYFASSRQKKQDTEFMPEVEGTVREDSPWLSRITLWVTCALLLTALGWANFAVLDEVTTGEGKVPQREAKGRSPATNPASC